MPEPGRLHMRPTTMKTVALVVAALVLAGCGNQSSGSEDSGGTPESQGTSASQKIGACAADSPEVTGARTIASVDLDGDGTPETVKLTGSSGTCANTLFTRVGGGYVSTTLGGDGLPLARAYGVQVPGRDGQLLVTRQEHPRGGFQLRLYAASAGQLAELQSDGQSLVPFVATDVQEHPLSVDCTDGGLVLTEAVAHEPIGIVPAWDIKRTTYTLDGTTVTKGATQEIADNVLAHQLGRKFPALVAHEAFAGCRVS
jgi:hypothetical protein